MAARGMSEAQREQPSSERARAPRCLPRDLVSSTGCRTVGRDNLSGRVLPCSGSRGRPAAPRARARRSRRA
eukprot:2190926-Prymnesium_polylepis.1